MKLPNGIKIAQIKMMEKTKKEISVILPDMEQNRVCFEQIF